MFEQISIDEWLQSQEPKKDLREPCGRFCEVEWCSLQCFFKRGYIRDPSTQKWARDDNGNCLISNNPECDWIPINEENPWVRLCDCQKVYFDPKSVTAYDRTDHDPVVLDYIARGTVDGEPKIIGLALCVSGWYEEFTELTPFYWKEDTHDTL